jgi:hypothetical protein
MALALSGEEEAGDMIACPTETEGLRAALCSPQRSKAQKKIRRPKAYATKAGILFRYNKISISACFQH